ncbi:MAG: hypothetical protein HY894_07170 [Deltaproteobacteria bacterium]|nr:hypothetical protein [Deltaproteobacteria bacterium]
MKKLIFIPLFVLLFAVSAIAETDMPQEVRDTRHALMTGSLVVKGEGAAPQDRPLSPAQKRIMALRAAKIMAARELSEVVDGISISGETTVVNAAAASDTIKSSVQGLIKGAQVVKEVYDPVSEMAVVYLSMPMTGSNGLVASILPQVLMSAPPAAAPPYMPPPTAPEVKPAAFDGLILDAREQAFKPALINRVVTKGGEVLYDPAKVAQNILVERGAAEYTNDVGKAKALLGERGASNPAVVKVSGVIKSTDVEVSPEDASAIFSSNQTAHYLEGAKVVFVLK